MVSRLRVLRCWRRYVEVVVEAVKRVVPEARVYLVGGAAEGRLTVLSDIDIVVVLPKTLSLEEAAELRARIWEEAEKLGLPLYAPIDLHFTDREGLQRYMRRGRVIELS